MDGDYDWDRYNSDPDYADGVDDAMAVSYTHLTLPTTSRV